MQRSDTRAVWVYRWVEQIRQDIGYAFRMLRRSPGFATVVVLTLGVGIGATAAIYAVVDRVLLQPLPFTDSDRLVRVVENVPRRQAGLRPFQRGVTYPQFLEWRARTTTLADMAAIGPSVALVKTADGSVRLWGTSISAGAFASLGVRAMLGRILVPADEAEPNVLVLGFDSWRRVFHADPTVVGKTVEFLSPQGGRRLLTVVGVLSADFEFPVGDADFYTPIVANMANDSRVTLIGRVRRGVTLDAAVQEAETIGTALTPPLPANAPALAVPRFEVQRLKDLAVEEVRPALRVLLAAVAVVLLIVCANVSNLLLARGSARQREIAVRCAVGASRGRIVRQILTECLVLAAIAGVVGLLLAASGVTLVKMLAPVEAPGIFRFALGASILPRINEIGIDPKLFALASGAAAMTSLAFGVLPAFYLSRPNEFNRMGPRTGGSRGGPARTRAVLVVGQLVMATVLLVAAGLLIRSFEKLSTVNKGYDPSNVVAFQLVFPSDYPIARQVETIEALLARLRATPNIEAAGFTRAGMMIPEQITVGTFVPQGRTLDEMRSQPVWPSLRPVSRGYLSAMRVPILEGRDLEEVADRSMPPIVISRSVARQFGATSHVGRVVDWHVGKGPAVPLRIVGVAEDLRNTTPDHEPYPEVFIDYRDLLAIQQRSGEPPERRQQQALGLLSFAARARTDPRSVIPVLTQIVRSVDPNAGIDAILPVDNLVASSVARPRFYAVITGVFAIVAGLLAVIGIYAVVSYAVTQRTQEIGIRMALGAQRTHVVALVLRQGVLLTAAGITLGLIGAAVGTRLLQGLLFGVTPLDTATFTAVSLTLLLVATLASYLPARRATKVDPMLALRSE